MKLVAVIVVVLFFLHASYLMILARRALRAPKDVLVYAQHPLAFLFGIFCLLFYLIGLFLIIFLPSEDALFWLSVVFMLHPLQFIMQRMSLSLDQEKICFRMIRKKQLTYDQVEEIKLMGLRRDGSLPDDFWVKGEAISFKPKMNAEAVKILLNKCPQANLIWFVNFKNKDLGKIEDATAKSQAGELINAYGGSLHKKAV